MGFAWIKFFILLFKKIHNPPQKNALHEEINFKELVSKLADCILAL